MKKAICVILTVFLLAILCGCGSKTGESFTRSERFVIIFGKNPNGPYRETIIADKDTGVLYLVIYGYDQFGITPLLDAEGKPLLIEVGADKKEDP